MPQAGERPAPPVDQGTQDGLRRSVQQAYAGIAAEPLPHAHVELLLALRRREREQAARGA